MKKQKSSERNEARRRRNKIVRAARKARKEFDSKQAWMVAKIKREAKLFEQPTDSLVELKKRLRGWA